MSLLENRDPSMRVAVLTVSDAGFRGERADSSGDAAAEWAEWQGAAVVARAIVPDDTVEIARVLLAWCDDDAADLVLTTGGTGLSARDVTPEATRAVIEREAVGIAERLRVLTGAEFPRAALSRGVCGVRNRTLIVNLPGSTNGVRETLAALVPIAMHAVDILRGVATDHSAAPDTDRPPDRFTDSPSVGS
jgi:molybdopterin adenylyltransferase